MLQNLFCTLRACMQYETLTTFIAKSLITMLHERQTLFPWLIFYFSDVRLTVALRSKSASERNCIQFEAVRGWKHCVLIEKLTEDHQHQAPNNLFALYSLLFFGIISEK
ncbi:hypothetical protein T11_11502 [Trichinella zimbabwensis]|uniref:Uncharacterized protein n=1 Tax=Trichinella zimbabwensis TaxID=268475 RepID=A0A0V1HAV2_9BILA|nr:hypothetical protein T11_11502 [Trichinella zimbabwensis]